MILNNNFRNIFGKLPIIGMIHLAGDEPVKRAVDEVKLYEEEGLDGIIVENYHGDIYDVQKTLDELSMRKNTISIGINILPNNYVEAFTLAEQYKAKFIQLDFVAGHYQRRNDLKVQEYSHHKDKFSDIVVLGGVWPKYYTPEHGSVLEDDLKTGMKRAEAIVVTGEGTGKETPMEKILEFRRVLGQHPLIIGAGLNLRNAREQLMMADGAIVGTYFKKDGRTENYLEQKSIRELMGIAREVRAQKYS